MGFTLLDSTTVQQATAAGDEFARFHASTDDVTFTTGAGNIDQNVIAVAVGPDSEIDAFDLTYPNPQNTAGRRDRVRIDPKHPFAGRLPIGGVSPASLILENARPANFAVMNAALLTQPISEVLFYIGTPTGTIGGPRPPSFTSASGATSIAGETNLAQRYCYGRHRFYATVAVAAGAAVTIRIAGRKLAGTVVIETDLATASIGAGGGNFIANNLCGPYDMIRIYITGATAAGAVTYSLEVRDED